MKFIFKLILVLIFIAICFGVYKFLSISTEEARNYAETMIQTKEKVEEVKKEVEEVKKKIEERAEEIKENLKEKKEKVKEAVEKFTGEEK
jgi:flagellar biosynthesis/type III secretory pathway M-ring protein FliF/YscJ